MILLLYALNNIVYHFVPFLNFIFYYCLYHLATQTTRLPTEPCWREQRRGKRCSGGMEVGLLIQIMAILPQHQDLLPSRLFQLLQRNRRQKAPAPTAEEQGECVSLMQFQCPGLVSPAPCTASPRGQGQPSRSFQQGRHHSSPGGIFVPFYCISAFRRIACSGRNSSSKDAAVSCRELWLSKLHNQYNSVKWLHVLRVFFHTSALVLKKTKVQMVILEADE